MIIVANLIYYKYTIIKNIKRFLISTTILLLGLLEPHIQNLEILDALGPQSELRSWTPMLPILNVFIFLAPAPNYSHRDSNV